MASDFERLLRKGKPARPRRRARRSFSPILIVRPLALAAGLLTFTDPGTGLPLPAATVHDAEHAHFARCAESRRVTCVIDGDTFWYHGEKIRIADINAPEVGEPHCASEARRGAAATVRLQALLNAGAFSLERRLGEADRDRYGRSLREVTRGGASLGETLVDEGFAERWKGHRGNWC